MIRKYLKKCNFAHRANALSEGNHGPSLNQCKPVPQSIYSDIWTGWIGEWENVLWLRKTTNNGIAIRGGNYTLLALHNRLDEYVQSAANTIRMH